MDGHQQLLRSFTLQLLDAAAAGGAGVGLSGNLLVLEERYEQLIGAELEEEGGPVGLRAVLRRYYMLKLQAFCDVMADAEMLPSAEQVG